MRKIGFAVLAVAIFASVQGCGGGCDIVSSALTLGVNLNIGNLSPCQVQTLFTDVPAIADQLNIAQLEGITLPEITEEQAQAFVDFLNDQDIQTFEELEILVTSSGLTFEDLPPALQDLYTEFISIN